jgi:hypothetical protein
MEISVPVSIGELLDKLSIVEIKKKKILDKDKLKYLSKEYDLLEEKATEIKNINEVAFNNFYDSLLETNLKLWHIEDDIRELESLSKFNDDFIKLARDVYITNDKRFDIKSEINKFFGSSIIEQKELKEY